MVENGIKIVGTDMSASRFIEPEDIGATAVWKDHWNMSMLLASDTYEVPVQEVNQELMWYSPYKDRIDFANDSVLCQQYGDLIPEGLQGYNFYNCMRKVGWHLRETTVRRTAGMAELRD
jgi:hypothetical protein